MPMDSRPIILRGGLCAASLLVGGCTMSGRSLAVDIEERVWSGPAILSFENDDTLTLRDMAFFVRSDSRFRDDTLTLHIELFTPDSLHLCEPFLFSPTGHLLPHSGQAHLSVDERSADARERETAALYRRRVRFGKSGDYRFVVTPCRPVEGVEAVGIHIEPSK